MINLDVFALKTRHSRAGYCYSIFGLGTPDSGRADPRLSGFFDAEGEFDFLGGFAVRSHEAESDIA